MLLVLYFYFLYFVSGPPAEANCTITMADYAKKTVAELQEILKSRGLASSGKKADLVARLTEADKTAGTGESAYALPTS